MKTQPIWAAFSISVRLLTVMSFPCTFCDLHIRKYGFKAGIFRTARIYAKSDLSAAFPHMAYTHLRKILTVTGTFNAIIRLTAAETIPHGLNVCGYGSCCPVRIPVICLNIMHYSSMTKYKIRAVLAGVSCAVKVFKKVLFVIVAYARTAVG